MSLSGEHDQCAGSVVFTGINDVKELNLGVDIDCIDNNKGKYSTNGPFFICFMLWRVGRRV